MNLFRIFTPILRESLFICLLLFFFPSSFPAGYDVFLGNFRGLVSREHVNKDISSRRLVLSRNSSLITSNSDTHP